MRDSEGADDQSPRARRSFAASLLAPHCDAVAALCAKKKSGVVVFRPTCRPRETQIDAQLVGPQGPPGPPGPPGPTTDALPSGQTLRGVFGVSGVAASNLDVFASLSFGIAVQGDLVAKYVKAGDPVPVPGCTGGTVFEPKADRGYLCVFENYTYGPVQDRGVFPPGGSSGFTSAQGTIVYAYGTNAFPPGDFIAVTGAWAVTAP